MRVCVGLTCSKVTFHLPTNRGEFESDGNPDLNKDVYLQDIHCVSSLCKAYFRELPNPLLTYQLYDKFAVSSSDTLHTIFKKKKSYIPHFMTSAFVAELTCFLVQHISSYRSLCVHLHMTNKTKTELKVELYKHGFKRLKELSICNKWVSRDYKVQCHNDNN